MIQYERQQQILSILQQSGTASVRALSTAVFASEASVRRDIEVLEKQGYVKRIYGGVMLSRHENSVIPLDLRDPEHSAIKEQLAQRAASLVPDGATVLIDASSTTRRILRYLERKRDLKIITNNLRLLQEARDPAMQLYGTGGAYDPGNHAFVGPAAETYVRGISADIFFFSSQGITEEGEITDVSEEETSLRRVMLSRARHRIFLCDSSKIGIRRVFTLCTRHDVDEIICDTTLPWEK
jgi:DeoR/GlpR family transcriptional regulator of sugar metabolism